MKALERVYSKSERIVVKARFSFWIFLREIVLAALLGGLLTVLWLYGDKIEGAFTQGAPVRYLVEHNLKWAVFGSALFVLAVTLLHALSRYRKELIITEDKFIYKKGVLDITCEIIPLNVIKSVESHQNFLQILLGYGKIMVYSDAEKPICIRSLVRPERLSRRIMKQTSQMRQRDNGKAMSLQLTPTGTGNRRNAGI